MGGHEHSGQKHVHSKQGSNGFMLGLNATVNNNIPTEWKTINTTVFIKEIGQSG